MLSLSRTNVPVKRTDGNDLVYMTMDEKFEAIVGDADRSRSEIKAVRYLVGTASVEASEAVI